MTLFHFQVFILCIGARIKGSILILSVFILTFSSKDLFSKASYCAKATTQKLELVPLSSNNLLFCKNQNLLILTVYVESNYELFHLQRKNSKSLDKK